MYEASVCSICHYTQVTKTRCHFVAGLHTPSPVTWSVQTGPEKGVFVERQEHWTLKREHWSLNWRGKVLCHLNLEHFQHSASVVSGDHLSFGKRKRRFWKPKKVCLLHASWGRASVTAHRHEEIGVLGPLPNCTFYKLFLSSFKS